MTNEPRIRVFAHVARGFSAETWNGKYQSGALIGLNEPYAYGYHRANDMGCDVTYSSDHALNPVDKLARYALRLLFGFDLLHAWKNRQGIFAADIVWTHTESQFLAILMLSQLTSRAPPRMIAQSVWLIDGFDRLDPLSRAMRKSLIRKADILTFHSTLNAAVAGKLFPEKPIQVVRYGVNSDAPKPVVLTPGKDGLKIIAVGNDRHRNWAALIDQLKGSRHDVAIVSRNIREDASAIPNIRIATPATNAELEKLYAESDIAIVPLKANMHASGITAICEALLSGKPTICTDTGGLRGYFSDDHVYFADPAASGSIAAAVEAIIADPDLARRKTAAAQAVIASEINSRVFVEDHVTISRRLLGLPPRQTAAPDRAQASG